MFTLDRSKDDPLYLQVVRAMEEGIRKGRFKPGQALPGTRILAGQLCVNRNTTLAAYRELEAQGWLEVSPDKGTFVAMDLPEAMATATPGWSAVDSASWKRPSPPRGSLLPARGPPADPGTGQPPWLQDPGG